MNPFFSLLGHRQLKFRNLNTSLISILVIMRIKFSKLVSPVVGKWDSLKLVQSQKKGSTLHAKVLQPSSVLIRKVDKFSTKSPPGSKVGLKILLGVYDKHICSSSLQLNVLLH